MNYHSDHWIMDRVQEHYNEALESFPKDRIVGIFYQGSGNYGLDYEGSDVDTKLIVTPTFKDIAMNKKYIIILLAQLIFVQTMSIQTGKTLGFISRHLGSRI